MSVSRLLERLSVRAKLLIISISAVLLVGGVGGATMLSAARSTLESQIDSDLQRSAELLTSLVRLTSAANTQSYLRGIAEKNVEVMAALQREVDAGHLTLQDAQQKGRDFLLSQTIGDTGYVYVVDGQGIIRVHPKAKLLGVDLSKYAFIQKQKRDKVGYLEYDWANPGETTQRPKALAMAYFKPWDWIISASSYREEFDKLTNLSDLSASILAIRFGETGYPYVIDEKGLLIIHPKLAGTNIFGSKDARGRQFIRELCEQKNGRIVYYWQNPGEAEAREKIVVFRYLPARKWIVATSIYTDELYRPMARLKVVLLSTVGGIVGLLVLAMYVAGTAISRPLGKLMEHIAGIWQELGLGTHVSQVQAGVPVGIKDEIQALTHRFNDMAIGIRHRDRQLDDHRRELESQVESRTLELSGRNADMRLVLDTIDQALAVVEKSGALSGERSRKFVEWFGATTERAAPFFQYLAPSGSPLEDEFRLGWEAVVEDLLPLELTLEQLPKNFCRDGRHYAVSYMPILDEAGGLLRVLLIVSDVSAVVAQLVHEAEQKEFLAVFERVMKDRTGFVEFFNEGSRITDELASAPPVDDAVLARRVHTLKGNAGLFGVGSVVRTCHELETQAVEGGVQAMRNSLPALVNQWTSFSERVVPLMGTKVDNIVEVHYNDLEQLAQFVRAGAHAGKVLDALERLKLEPTQVRFERVAEQARAIALRLGKGHLQVLVQANGVRLPSEPWQEFWAALVHVVRNAIDHGIESSEERQSSGKADRPTLVLWSEERDGLCTISVEDDGRGIDWDAIRERARTQGLPHSSRDELVAALFADGLSTKSVVTEISGRGIGMGAVRDAVKKLKGTLMVLSEPGCGTTIRFKIPVGTLVRVGQSSLLPGARPSLLPPTIQIKEYAQADSKYPTLVPRLSAKSPSQGPFAP